MILLLFNKINFIIGGFESFLNIFVTGFNLLKQKINEIDIQMPEILGGAHIGFDLPMSSPVTLPRLADGGFVPTGQMFIAREKGPELVGRIGNKTAVANNQQIIAGIASAVYDAMIAAQEESRSGGSSRIVVQIGERTVGEAAVQYINGQIVQTGASPIYS